MYLNNCLGDILAQAGDVVSALESYKRAASISPQHPLPYVNAARVYQQLNQQSLSSRHISKALALDESLALTKVDMAQNLLFAGQLEEALELLEQALGCAKHVSEIRDVLTAKAVANMQRTLEVEMLYLPPVMFDVVIS